MLKGIPRPPSPGDIPSDGRVLSGWSRIASQEYDAVRGQTLHIPSQCGEEGLPRWTSGTATFPGSCDHGSLGFEGAHGEVPAADRRATCGARQNFAGAFLSLSLGSLPEGASHCDLPAASSPPRPRCEGDPLADPRATCGAK